MSVKTRIRVSSGRREIRRVLVPNRGEIALRIVRTLRTLGVRAIVAHSEIDTDGAAVRLADDAICLGPAPASESYLSVPRILEAARRVGADAIHPGYGFLSEREPFARAVEDAGLTFIGPAPETMRLMGDKVGARRALGSAGIPLVPGNSAPIRDVSQLRTVAKRLGLPLMLKAAGGGGGKGMRLVREPDELDSALQLASSEAEKAFGDATIFAEHYLQRARHVEVQVLGDGAGGARLFPERDCSVQRRHQKIVEETPCPVLDEETRHRLLTHALQAVQLSRYRGAGTLEFLLDASGGIFFLEMNTRLQVEHPITEAICGVDLVAQQVEVARGAVFPGKDIDKVFVPGRGVAVEFRVNAEEPARDFEPATGTISSVRFAGGPGIRVDSAAESGTLISPHYDSLIAKLVAWASSREAALARLGLACQETRISGVPTTLPLALSLLEDPDFLAGRHHCQYLEARLADPGFLEHSAEPGLARTLAIAAAHLRASRHFPPGAVRMPGPLPPWALAARRGKRWEGAP